MNREEIKSAVLAGKKVIWRTSAYEVIHTGGQWLIRCVYNNYCTGLTWIDEVTLNGEPEDFQVVRKEGGES